MAEYEQKADSFNVEFKPQNVDTKFPSLQFDLKVGDDPFKLAVWVRNGKFGKQFSGKTSDLTRLLNAMFGKKLAVQSANQAAPSSAPEPVQPAKKEPLPF